MPDDRVKQFGRKIFFLYPHSVIQEELVKEVVRNEYEVYFLNDHEKLLKLLQLFNNAILFINIDENLKEPEWASYIRDIMNNADTKNVRIGILSYNEDRALA